MLAAVLCSGKHPARMTEQDQLKKQEANERRRLHSLKQKREAEENVKAKIRKATSAKFRKKETREAAVAASAMASQVSAYWLWSDCSAISACLASHACHISVCLSCGVQGSSAILQRAHHMQCMSVALHTINVCMMKVWVPMDSTTQLW